jgi:RimJ/RimL family protein N-acetyltransferase
MKRLIASVVDSLRRDGVRGLLHRLHAALRHEAWFVRWRLDLDAWTPSGGAPPALDVVRGTLDELDAFRRQPPESPLASEFYVDRIDGVRWFYLARWNGAIAHVTWIYAAGDSTPLISLGAGEVEVRRVHTLRAHRGRRLFTYVLDAILRDLGAAGARVVYAHVEVTNHASSRAFAAAGFRPVGVVRMRKLLGVGRVGFRPGAASRSATVGA